jgi:hypothetical protein
MAWLLMVALMTGQPIGLAAADYLGQVTFNGIPVPGVTVTATQGPLKTAATTNQDGIYHLADLADGLWKLTIEMFGFETISEEITIPAQTEPPPAALTVRSFAELASHSAGAQAMDAPSFPRAALTSVAASEADGTAAEGRIAPPVDLPVLVGATGLGAADGLLINGSLNNGASTPFALPRGLGNNRPRPPSIYTYAAGLQLGNSAWDARPFSLTGANALKPSYTDTQILATVEGPVRLPRLRNAITLNVGYQGASTSAITTQFARMPTDQERAGDFSQTLDARGRPVRIVDPTDGEPFANGVLPGHRISPQAAALLAYYPRAGQDARGGFNYQAPLVAGTRQDGVRSRASYTLNAQNRIGSATSYQHSRTDTTSLFGFEDAARSAILDTQATWSLSLSRYMTLNARYQYTRTRNESVPHFANRVNVSGNAGISGNDQDPRNWGPPSLTFASDLAGLTTARYASTTTQGHIWAVDVSRFRGAHTLEFGGEVRTHLNDVFAEQDPRGGFGFTGAASGVDFADFLLGLPRTSTIAFGNPDKQFRSGSYAAYVKDDWRIRPSLTLMLGLRWEYETPIAEAQGRLANLDVSAGFTAVSPVVAGQAGSLTGLSYTNALVDGDKRGFQPRVGIAWRPALGSSMVVHAGYGVYRNTNVYQSIATLLAAQPPFSTTFNIASDPSNPLTLAEGFRAAGSTLNTFAVDPRFRVSSAHTWDASVQQDFPGSLTFTATYLGIRGTNLMQQILPNTFPAGAANPCPTCPVGFRYLTSNGRSSRHSGQLQLRRRLSAGFTGMLQYTLAHALDDAAAFGGASLEGAALVQNWLDPDAEYARSNFDQRHLVSASVEYTTGSGIAGGTLLDGWKGRLLKDWTFTANVSAGSGLPLTPVYFAPIGGTGIIGSLRADTTGVVNDPPRGSYANPAAFTVPAPGEWGTASRNSMSGPSTFALNAAVARTFRIGNRLNFDWRIDALNVLNRVTYASVNTLVTSPQFGLPTRTNDMRKLRTSIRVRF